MADSTLIERTNTLANLFPPSSGWCCCDAEYSTSFTLNSVMICQNSRAFPMSARLRIFDQSEIIAEWFSDELVWGGHQVVTLNPLIAPRTLHHGYFEVTVVPLNPEGMKASFFNEVWAQVYTRDGTTAVEYPLLVGRGADPSMIDSSYLYYPGVMHTDQFAFSLVAMNHQSFTNEYEVALYSADGEHQLYASRTIPKKSLQVHALDELFPTAADMLRAGPGMLVFHFKYKMNAFIQTRHRPTGILSGMDHLGLLFGNISEDDMIRVMPSADPTTAHANRVQDRLICYCQKVSEHEIRALASSGMNLQAIQSKCGAGTVCLGCVADLEELVGEMSETTKTWRAARWQSKDDHGTRTTTDD